MEIVRLFGIIIIIVVVVVFVVVVAAVVLVLQLALVLSSRWLMNAYCLNYYRKELKWLRRQVRK